MIRRFAPVLFFAAASLHAQSSVRLYTDLGPYHKAIGTKVPEAQQYFDQGLRLAYGFNHAEAIRSFTRATQLDPKCAICWWGIAYAAGPHYNRAWHQYDPVSLAAMLARTGAALAQAQARLANASPVEQS